MMVPRVHNLPRETVGGDGTIYDDGVLVPSFAATGREHRVEDGHRAQDGGKAVASLVPPPIFKVATV